MASHSGRAGNRPDTLANIGATQYSVSTLSKLIRSQCSRSAGTRGRPSNLEATVRPQHLTRTARPPIVHRLCLAPEAILLTEAVRQHQCHRIG
jgi:hypothetical protein